MLYPTWLYLLHVDAQTQGSVIDAHQLVVLDESPAQGVHQFLIVFRVFKADFLKGITHMFVGKDRILVVPERSYALLDDVIFIPDFSDKLFQDILHCDQAKRSAVIVRHNSKALPVLRHQGQHLIHFGTLVDEEWFVQQSTDIDGVSLMKPGFDKPADLQDTDNMVDRPFIHR